MFMSHALGQFIRRGEKTLPPVFAGRKAIMNDILAIARESWMIADHHLPGATRILQGAPGAGKSSILAKIAGVSASGQPGTGPAPRVLALNSADITCPADILIPLARLVNPDAAPAFLADYCQTRGVEGGVRVLGTGASGYVATTHAHREPEPTLRAFRDWADGLDVGTGITGPIIIAIDESQRFSEDPTTPLAKLLQGIHDGCNLPLTLVMAGLCDTADKAQSMGLTRGLTVHPVGSLAAEDVASLMTGFCHHFGMDPRGHEEHLEQLAAPCEGWPRHLHFALAALATDALAMDGDLARLNCINWSCIQAAAMASRTRYYQAQQSPAMEESASLVAAVLHALKPGCRRFDVVNSIMAHEGVHPGRQWCLPADMNADMMTDHLVHQGALQTMPDGTMTCPIPSFRTWLVAAGRIADPEMVHAVTRVGDCSALRDLLAGGADPNATNAQGATPLHLAAHNGQAVIIPLLQTAGADLEARDGDGMTPLHVAALQAHPATVQSLIDAGADMKAMTADGWTALHAATRMGSAATVTVLLASGDAVNSRGADGTTPLHWAVQRTDTEAALLIHALLDYGADPLAGDTKGRPPRALAGENPSLVDTPPLARLERAAVSAPKDNSPSPAL